MIMDKETLFVALSNQKGGVGKSAFTILLASYFHYVENLNVAVIDCGLSAAQPRTYAGEGRKGH